MPNLVKKPTTALDPVSWHDSPDGGARGVITKGVSQPHIIDIDPQGRFDVYTLTKADKPKRVTSGKANNVTTAKTKATALATANIKGLRSAVKADIIDAKASPVQRREQPAWVVTLKVFIALALLVFAALLFARWALFHRPVWFFRFVGWAGASLFGAWRLLKALEDLDKRRTRLSQRKIVDAAFGKGGK